jgi:protocatechuate 3,4-dioxygenase beta subunit
LVAWTAAGQAPQSASPAVELQRATYLQRTAGDLDGAIQAYRQLIASHPADRDIAAQAERGLAQALRQKADPADQDAKTKIATLEGKVVDQMTGAPLKKTVLTLRPTGGGLESNERGLLASTETGEDGFFRFSNITPGPYWFMAERAGYAQQYFNGRSNKTRGSVIRAHAGDEIKSIVFKLIPNAVISGKVLDEDGDPMHASVVVYRQAYRTGGKTLELLTRAATGAKGEYSISVFPGKYLLVAASNQNVLMPASAPARTASSETQVFTYAPMFYPNSFEQAGAIEISAGAGAELPSFDFHMTKVKAYRIRGKAVGSAGMIQLLPKAGPSPSIPVQFGRIEENGSFELPAVLPGSYYAIANGPQGFTMVANQPVVVASQDREALTLQFSPMPELKGTLTVEGNKLPVEGMQVGFDSFDTNANPTAHVGKDGKFVISGILPGRYHPWAGLGGGGRYVKSIVYNGRDIKDTGIDLTEGVAGPVDIVISPNAADVSGSVVDDDGKPCAGVHVILAPDSGAYLGHNSVTTDAQGRFDISFVRPGDYKVYALEEALYLAWFDKEFMKPYLSRAISLSVRENDKKILSLKLLPEAQH